MLRKFIKFFFLFNLHLETSLAACLRVLHLAQQTSHLLHRKRELSGGAYALSPGLTHLFYIILSLFDFWLLGSFPIFHLATVFGSILYDFCRAFNFYSLHLFLYFPPEFHSSGNSKSLWAILLMPQSRLKSVPG